MYCNEVLKQLVPAGPVENVDVAIVGAGPGGLALALGLQTVAPSLKVKVATSHCTVYASQQVGITPACFDKHLFRLQVFEKARELHPIGACIVRPAFGTELVPSTSRTCYI